MNKTSLSATAAVLTGMLTGLASQAAADEHHLLSVTKSDVIVPGRWTVGKANAWDKQQPWLVGCNFTPSTAINQLEMWQADTFDPETIDRELGWAANIGMNSIRVYLHDLLWQQDSEGFLKRVDQFLGIAERVGSLKPFGRPLLCTEYLARGNGSRFEEQLPYFKTNKIGAYNWGFVAGKIQTQYPWASWRRKFTAEPKVWHHDVLNPDGTPHIRSEIELIKSLTEAKNK